MVGLRLSFHGLMSVPPHDKGLCEKLKTLPLTKGGLTQRGKDAKK